MTRWSDLEILESVRDSLMLTPQARERALELAEAGYIDSRGVWRLTGTTELLLASKVCSSFIPKALATEGHNYREGRCHWCGRTP